jgi:hypothetical protein
MPSFDYTGRPPVTYLRLKSVLSVAQQWTWDPAKLSRALTGRDADAVAAVYRDAIGYFPEPAVWLHPHLSDLLTAVRHAPFREQNLVASNAHAAAGIVAYQALEVAWSEAQKAGPSFHEAMFMKDGPAVTPLIAKRMVTARSRIVPRLQPLVALAQVLFHEIDWESCRLALHLGLIGADGPSSPPGLRERAIKAWKERLPEEREVLRAVHSLGAIDKGSRKSASDYIPKVMVRLKKQELTKSTSTKLDLERGGHWLTELGFECVVQGLTLHHAPGSHPIITP